MDSQALDQTSNINTEGTEYEKFQPAWKNEPTYTDLSKDFIASNSAHNLFLEQLLKRQEFFSGGKPIVHNNLYKSTTRPKIIRKQAEWKYAAIEEPFLSTRDMYKIEPRTAEDTLGAKQNEILINYQWSTKVNKTKTVNDIIRNLVDEGTVIVKCGWEAEEGTKIVEKQVPVYASPEQSLQMLKDKIASGDMTYEDAQQVMQAGQPMQTGTRIQYEEETILVKNQPTYEVCNVANVRIDPSCEGVIEKAGFVIHEYDTSLADLKRDEYVVTYTEDQVMNQKTGMMELKKTKHEKGFYRNLDEVKNLNMQSLPDRYASVSGQTFRYNDRARKKIRAFEYWGYWDINGDDTLVPIVATWVGTILIRLEENPFPHKKLPFALATYMPVKREVHGEADGDLIIDNQNTIGRMIRAAEDITATQAIGQTLIDEQLFPSPVQKNNYEKGNTVYFRHGIDPRTAIHKQTVEPVPSSVFQMIQLQMKEAEDISGTRSFGETSAGSMIGAQDVKGRQALDAAAKRELSILRRVSEMFKELARMTVAMNQAFLEEEEIVRITNTFVAIRRDDLVGEFDFDMDISTPEKDNEKAQHLTMLMQTNAASMDPAMQHIMYAKIASLWKMPDVADLMNAYKAPEPHPMQEELLKLQVENQRLENVKLKKQVEELDSKISERVAKAILHEADINTKNAQAAFRVSQSGLLEAQTELANKQVDNMDNEPTDNTGSQIAVDNAKTQNKLKLQEHKRLSDMDKLAVQHRMNQHNAEDNHGRGIDMAVHNSDLKTMEGLNNLSSATGD